IGAFACVFVEIQLIRSLDSQVQNGKHSLWFPKPLQPSPCAENTSRPGRTDRTSRETGEGTLANQLGQVRDVVRKSLMSAYRLESCDQIREAPSKQAKESMYTPRSS